MDDENGNSVLIATRAYDLVMRVAHGHSEIIGVDRHPWAQPYLPGRAMDLNLAFNFADTLTHHGFTGQEQMDESGLVHMGGRIYSPGTMRFTSPDPFVQDPSDMQSYNRYSYVMNNPLTHTDPSGYWGHRQQEYLRTAAAIAITVVTSGAASGFVAAGETAEAAGIVAAGGAAADFVQTGNLKGAVLGAIEAEADFGIGQSVPYNDTATQLGNPVGNVVSHAALGGVMAVLRGGKFGHGFVSAGLQAEIDPHLVSDEYIIGGIKAAIVGGTISIITGGKFANGALSAAFEFEFNACLTTEACVHALRAGTVSRAGWQNQDDHTVGLGAYSISTSIG